MADKKITALTDLSTGIAGADLLHVVEQKSICNKLYQQLTFVHRFQ